MNIHSKAILLCAACSFFLVAHSPAYGAQSQPQTLAQKQEKQLTPQQKQDFQQERLIINEGTVFDVTPG